MSRLHHSVCARVCVCVLRVVLLVVAVVLVVCSHLPPKVPSSSEGTLGTFSVRFCDMFVLPCLAVLVPGGALATLLLLAAAEAAGELMGD